MWAALFHTYWDWGLGFHADADGAGTQLLFRICSPHVFAFLIYFFHTRK